MESVDQFLNGFAESRPIFDVLWAWVNQLGPVILKVGKSQLTFGRKKTFAWVWVPGRYLHGRTAPLVLTLCFSTRNPSARWKEIVEPVPGRFIHHLELYTTADVDDEVKAWLADAWERAG